MSVSVYSDKIKKFQNYYYLQNGVQISYREALYYYNQMNADERISFEKYYTDETGYEVVNSKGYDFDIDLEIEVAKNEDGTDKKKKVKKKQKQQDGTIKYVDKDINAYSSNLSNFTTDFIVLNGNLEAYAKKNGLVLDPQWAVYSAEEIIQMENDGVLIPQEVLDIAHSIHDSQNTGNQEIEGENDADTAEKEPFLDLIPKAQKKVEKCEENNEKITDKINDILPEKSKKEKEISDKLDAQTKAFQEYEARIREWRVLQNKVNNGEELSNSEAKRYADIIGMLNDKNIDDSDMGFDKKAIARSMNELNILSVLGEKLAEETIEIADTLADYTSKTNYKSTFNETLGKVGPLAVFSMMVTGKNLAKDGSRIGNDTKEFSQDTKKTVIDIADVMEIELADLSEVADDNITADEADTQDDINKADADTVKPEEANADDAAADTETKEEVKSPEVSTEEDFVLNDDSVKELTKEAVKLNGDLLKQSLDAVKAISVAKNDKRFAKIASKKVTKLVEQFHEEEEKRQEKVVQLEEENKQADTEIKDLTGKSAEEVDEEEGKDNKDKENPEADKVQSKKQKINSNKKEIEGIQAESDSAKEKFISKTTKESERISQAVPKETEALENDTKQKEEIIPQSKERLDFTNKTGGTYEKMGRYRIIVGIKQILTFQRIKGAKNIAKGTISAALGLGAQIVSKTPIPKIAEKATEKAVKEENGAISSLMNLDAQMVSVTGVSSVSAQQGEEQDNSEQSAENSQPAEPAEPAAQTETTAPAAQTETAQPAAQTETAQASAATQQTTDNMVNANVSASVATTGAAAPVDTAAAAPATETAPEDNSASGSKNSKKEEEISTDEAGENVKDAENSAKDDSDDSVQVLKDTEKDEKQLEKEAKKLQKEMKQDEKAIQKMTKESQRAAQKQAEILVQYEQVSAESEEIVTIEEQKQQAGSANSAPTGGAAQMNASKGFSVNPNNNDSNGNIQKLQENEVLINVLGSQFSMYGNKIDRNRTKIKKLEKKTKVNHKKYDKKCTIRTKKMKEAEKKEQEKQKRLAKQLAVVGIANNVFSITLSTGTIMMLVPWTAAAGAVLVDIGTYGIAACAVTKATINMANGNMTAALMGLGTAAVQIAGSFIPGAGAAMGPVLTAVSAGLQVVSTSAELVNNVRQVQGKEASGVFSKIGTVAGIAGSLTNVAGNLGNLGQTAGTFGKALTIASAVGTAVSSTSQVMTTFNLGDQKTAQLLGTIGGGLQTAASAVQLGQAFTGAKSKNQDTKDRANAIENNSNDKSKSQTTQNNGSTSAAATVDNTEGGKGIFGKIGNIAKKVGGAIGNTAKGAFGAVKNSGFGKAVGNIANKIGGGVSTAAGAIGNTAKGAFGAVKNSGLGKAVGNIANKIGGGISTAAGAVGNAFKKDGVFGKAVAAGKNAAGKVGDIAEKGFNSAKTNVQSAAAKLGLTNQNTTPIELPKVIAGEMPQLEINNPIVASEISENIKLDNGTYGKPETASGFTPEQLTQQIDALPECPEIEIDNDTVLAGMAALKGEAGGNGMSVMDKVGQWLELTGKITGVITEALASSSTGQQQKGSKRQAPPPDPKVLAKLKKWKQQREKRMAAYRNYQYNKKV